MNQVRIKKNEAQHKIKKVKGIGELLNIHIQIPDIEVNRNLEIIEIQECKLNPSGCKSSYEIVQKHPQVLHVELN